MDEERVERTLPGWRATSEAVAVELSAWREAHPKATLAEIEAVVYEAMQQLQARALGHMVQTSAAVDLAAQPAEERPRCPSCGGRQEPRGRQRRTIRPARQKAALEVERSYTVCATCGAGLFPPG
jgi:tRNA(Ile2) C34 agmatinyltransferase TiaS